MEFRKSHFKALSLEVFFYPDQNQVQELGFKSKLEIWKFEIISAFKFRVKSRNIKYENTKEVVVLLIKILE